MTEITVAIDEPAADQVLDTAVGLIPPQSAGGTSNLGPFTVGYSANVSFGSGDVDLIAPSTIRIVDFRANYGLSFSFGFDLSDFLPDFCIPQVCIDIPCVGRVCTPRICVDWPTVSIPVSFADAATATADFSLSIIRTGGVWKVEAVVLSIVDLRFGLATGALLVAIGAAATIVLLAIPFIGPVLAIAVDAILLAIGVAGVTGLLGAIVSPLVAGLRIPIYEQPVTFEVLPADGPNDPAVFITLDDVTAAITSDTEDELVLGVDFT